MRCTTALCTLWLVTASTAPALPASPSALPSGPPRESSGAAQSTAVALTLDAAVAEARAASPARRAAQLRAQAARAAAPWAGAYANPSVDIRTENWQPGGRTANDPLNDTFVVVTQPIEVSGKAGARRRLAEADAASKDIDVRRVERQLVLDVARSYLAAARALGRQVVLAAQAESTHEVVTILARRVAEGVTPEADLRKVEADVARLDTEATRVEIDLQANLALLGALLGREVPVARTDIVPPDAAAWHVPPPSQDALAEVPEVAAARQRAAAAAVAYDLARRERWPDLLVSGGYKRTAGVDTAVAGVSVSVPVFTRGRREVALGNAERLAAEQDAIAAERLARAEAAARLAEAQLLSDRAGRVERDVLVPAEIAWRAARSSFQEGAGDVLRLLDAERVYGDARREASDLRLEAVLAQVRAQLALGDKQP